MGDSAHTCTCTTHHTTPGMTHCGQKYMSKYVCKTKKTRRKSIGVLKPNGLTSRKPAREISFRTFGNNGSPSIYKQMDSTRPRKMLTAKCPRKTPMYGATQRAGVARWAHPAMSSRPPGRHLAPPAAPRARGPASARSVIRRSTIESARS